MEPDVVEIAPPPVASGSRNRKPRKAVIPEVIDVEQYEFRNVGVLNNDNKNKGKAIEVSSFNNIGSHTLGSYPLDLEMCQDPFDCFGLYNNEVMEIDDYSMFQDILDSNDIPTGVEMMMPQFSNLSSKGTTKASRSSLRNQTNGDPSLATSSVHQPWDYFPVLPKTNQTFDPSTTVTASMVQPKTPDIVMVPAPPSRPSKYDASASSSRPIVAAVISTAQETFLRDFKRFDTVDDFSDHHYASNGQASKQHSKNWVKKVQADWKILENDLPETIFVRACESRMDLLRAVIIGAEGTPYHDGLFFFDIQFPATYPSAPPKVYYHSGGLRINPNLYNCGKVCLSLLGTWSGNTREKWIPKESTMLQLLVSIQALILNQKPYFNEPGYEPSMGTQSGESQSKVYSENVFILSLKTMVYSLRRPPKHFEEFVRSHFFVRAHDVVKACNAYRDGAPVGSIVKGGVQDVEETDESGSKKFRTDVTSFMKTVVEELVKLGVKELEDKPEPPPESNNAKRECKKANRKRNRA